MNMRWIFIMANSAASLPKLYDDYFRPTVIPKWKETIIVHYEKDGRYSLICSLNVRGYDERLDEYVTKSSVTYLREVSQTASEFDTINIAARLMQWPKPRYFQTFLALIAFLFPRHFVQICEYDFALHSLFHNDWYLWWRTHRPKLKDSRNALTTDTCMDVPLHRIYCCFP